MQPGRLKLNTLETSAIRDRIMKEMLSLEEERMARMQEGDSVMVSQMGETSGSSKTMEDESIIRRELNKVDPSAVVFSESWAAKKVRVCAATENNACTDSAHVESDTTKLSLRTSSTVGLYVRHCEDGWRSSARTARRTANPRVPEHLDRGKMRLLGQAVRASSRKTCSP